MTAAGPAVPAVAVRCECCDYRAATTRIQFPDGDQALLCGSCTDDAVQLGLVTLTPSDLTSGEQP